jgi:hypothetical protein
MSLGKNLHIQRKKLKKESEVSAESSAELQVGHLQRNMIFQHKYLLITLKQEDLGQNPEVPAASAAEFSV